LYIEPGDQMESDLYNSIRELIKDIKKQLGKDNPVADFVSSAVIEKLNREKLNKFIEKE
jgi:hypothetical protein